MTVFVQCSLYRVFIKGRDSDWLSFYEQEGAEEELENNNEDAPDDVVGAEAEDKEQEKTAHAQNNKVYDKVWACTHSWYACFAD